MLDTIKSVPSYITDNTILGTGLGLCAGGAVAKMTNSSKEVSIALCITGGISGYLIGRQFDPKDKENWDIKLENMTRSISQSKDASDTPEEA